jgi:ubiquinone/menaquinone biosynthesis C-methylase UbiE
MVGKNSGTFSKNTMSSELLNSGERMVMDISNPQLTIEHLHRYFVASQFCKEKIVLDIACGEGYGSDLLAAKADQVIGMDNNEIAITHAVSKYRRDNLSFKKADALMIPLKDHTIDVIVCLETLEHLKDQDLLLTEFRRVLKSDGVLIISTPDKKYYSEETNYRNKFHLKELYSYEFETLLKKYFANIELHAQYTGSVSVIYPFRDTGIQKYSFAIGDFNKYSIRNDIPAPYLVAIASNKEVGKMFSIFDGHAIWQKMIDAEINKAVQSRSYKLAKALSSPYRLVKRLFS